MIQSGAHFKYKLCKSFPIKASNNKFLFDWCESNQNYSTTWKDYCFIKYSITININKDVKF